MERAALNDPALDAPSLADVLVGALSAMNPEQRDRTLADDPAKAVLWIRASAEYGLPEGQVAYGRLLLQGRGVAQDQVSALNWFRKAAERGDAEGQNMVGRCLENGWGVAADIAQAALWYERAARAGLDWAQYNLGHLYLDGLGVERDPARAFGLYLRAAEQGHVRAMNLTARCYEQGWGVGVDTAAARDWAQCSAEGGYFRGQYNFGLMLAEEGRVDEAAAWLEQAVAGAPEPSRTVMAWALVGRTEESLAEIGRRAMTTTPPPLGEAATQSAAEGASELRRQAPSVSFADSSPRGEAIDESGATPCS
jgi:TPR repeat protein